ncbi:hypothetical protein COO60DRAFT_1513935 [Scenedesmus sp. NREL 46B-D3]|nr:hypothetical protein COO60DRAFT_1513935 [Scenedesmus sp. NREL 46B-D3]
MLAVQMLGFVTSLHAQGEPGPPGQDHIIKHCTARARCVVRVHKCVHAPLQQCKHLCNMPCIPQAEQKVEKQTPMSLRLAAHPPCLTTAWHCIACGYCQVAGVRFDPGLATVVCFMPQHA